MLSTILCAFTYHLIFLLIDMLNLRQIAYLSEIRRNAADGKE